jgi:hypothetical protein
MTPQICTDLGGMLRHLSVDLHDDPGEDGGRIGLTLCSTLGRIVSASDQQAMDVGYDMFLSDVSVDVATLPPCDECERVAGTLVTREDMP